MNHHHIHWLEKAQVQLATLVSVVCVYFLAWSLLRPADPLVAFTFLGDGGFAGLATLAMVVWLVAALCTVMTITGRPEGAVLATAFGVGGLSLRSAQMRSLVWAAPDGHVPLMGDLAVESLALVAIALGAMVVIFMVRAGLAKVSPRLAWKPHGGLKGPSRRNSDGIATSDVREVLKWSFWPLSLIWQGMAKRIADTETKSRRLKGALRSALSIAIGTAIAIVLMLFLAASADRGQIIFALIASFTIGMLIAQQIAPARWSAAVWVAPSLAASLVYGVAMLITPQTAGNDWTSLPLFARALPIDWFSAGGGGALLGYWLSARLRHMKHLENQQSKGEK